MFYSPWSSLDVLIALVVVAISVFYVFWRKFSLRGLISGPTDELAADSPSSSAILSYYTAGHGLLNVHRGKLNDMAYSLYATAPAAPDSVHDIAYIEDDVAIYALELPFNTQSHFIGLTKDHRLNRLQFEAFLKSSGMEKIVLEGDFPDYFDIYAAKGQQFAVRTVLDPKAMAYVVDYCRSHFWEINDAELYFVITNTDHSDADNSSIIEQSQQFVTEIKPALMPGEPGAPVVHHEVPYGEYDGPALPCPICSKTMTMNDAWQACPDGQGILINGRNLARLHDGELQITTKSDKDTPHGQLTCPNCHNLMVNTGYEGGAVQIDSCEHCPFRWLDTSEIASLTSKPQP